MKRLTCVWAILTAGAWLVSPAGGQTAPAGDSAASQPAATTQSVEQPAEFTALADKAAKLRGLIIKGAAGAPGDLKQITAAGLAGNGVEFEIWAMPKASRIEVQLSRDQAVAVSDGEFAYSVAQREGLPLGRRRRVMAGNYYHAVPLASAAMDALNGYANLTASLRFTPVEPDARFAGLGELKWFRLEPATASRHHLLAGARSVRVALSEKDGVIRVLLAQLEMPDKPPRESVVLFESVKPAVIHSGQLLLPARMAKIKWKDMDSGQTIAPPEKVIVHSEP